MRPNFRKRERRHEPRDDVNASIGILCVDGEGHETVMRAQLVDISTKGARMLVGQRLPRSTIVYFYYYKFAIGGRGSVRHCGPRKQGYEIGIEFPSGTGWKPLRGSDLSALATKVNGATATLDPALLPSRT